MRKYWKRILAMVLAVAMVVPSVPMEANAATQEWEVKRGETVSFSELIEKLAPDADSTDVVVTVPIVVDKSGNTVEKTVKVTTEEFPYYVGSTDSASDIDVAFDATGTYTLEKGIGTVTGELNSSEYTKLKNDAEAEDSKYNEAVSADAAADAAVLAARAEVAAKKAIVDALENADLDKLQEIVDAAKKALDGLASYLPDIGKKPFQDAYNKAVKDLSDAKTAQENYDNALKEQKKAEDAAQLTKKAKEDAEASSDDAWSDLANYVNDLTVTADKISYNAADITYSKSESGYDFNVKVYDYLTIKVVDENGSLGNNLPEVGVLGEGVALDSKEDNKVVYKLYDTKIATLTVPAKPTYNFSVTGADANGSNYSVGPITADTEVVVTYKEVGASKINYSQGKRKFNY